jgi:hypothetical protein
LFPKNFFKERMKETCIMTFMKPEGLLLSWVPFFIKKDAKNYTYNCFDINVNMIYFLKEIKTSWISKNIVRLGTIPKGEVISD